MCEQFEKRSAGW